MTNIQSSLNQKQTKQHILRSGQKVYLYGETKFSGILVRPVERTYPPRWTVELDRGGYDSPTVPQITPINPQYIDPKLTMPFDDSTIEEREPETDNRQLEDQIIALKTQINQLKAENDILKKDLEIAKEVIRKAKDISPLKRISFKRVLRLAHDACMDVQRTTRGWILKMGDKARKFRRLADIWGILSQDNWYLEDIFSPDKLIAVELIQAPKPRKKPTPPDQKTYPRRDSRDIMGNRIMPKLSTV